MNIHFYNGKKKKEVHVQRVGRAQSHCNEHGIPQHMLASNESARRAQLWREVTGQGAEGELAFLTPQGCMQVPLGAGPDFPPGRPVEDLWAQRDPDICAPSTSSASLSLVSSRRSAMQSAVPLWFPQMPPLCWGPSPQSMWGTREAGENKADSVLLSCCEHHSTGDWGLTFLEEAASPTLSWYPPEEPEEGLLSAPLLIKASCLGMWASLIPSFIMKGAQHERHNWTSKGIYIALRCQEPAARGTVAENQAAQSQPWVAFGRRKGINIYTHG